MASMSIQVFDVGQGDSIFTIFPDGTTMLVDMGSTKSKRAVRGDVTAYFRERTKFGTPGQTLDYLVLTHGDIDHYNLVEGFLDTFRITVANLLYGGLPQDYGDLIGVLGSRQPAGPNVLGDPQHYPHRLNTFGGAELWLLGMDTRPITRVGDDGHRKNTSSVVLQIRYGGNEVLLTGDATRDTEQTILTQYASDPKLVAGLRSTVLKAEHHGSARTSFLPAWVKSVQPEYVFISSDRHGRYFLPQELAVDIIRENTKLAAADQHTYVSWYDPGDYGAPKAGFAGRDWYLLNTTEAIFTTLIALDFKGHDGVVGDVGSDYQITLHANGVVDVTPWT